MAIFDIFNAVLRKATELSASDVHISAGGPFRLRIKGQIVGVQGDVLKPQDTATIAAEILVASKKVAPRTCAEADRFAHRS